MVFGIISASNAVRKCEIVRGEAECYFTLPNCIALNPNTTVWTIILQINPTSTMSLIHVGTVLVEHSMLLLLKNLTIEGQKNSVATDCYCSNDIDRCGHGCWVRVQYGIEVGTM